MNFSLPKLGVFGALLSATLTCSAQITAFFNFDAVPAGSLANTFATPQISFHQAHYVPFTDSFGDAIPGTEHWEADRLLDLSIPVTVDVPSTGIAPSSPNALNAYFGPVIVLFDQDYLLSSFTVTLDNDPFGDSLPIAFVDATTILSELTADQTMPGLLLSAHNIAGVRGIVLPGGAYYDNLGLSLTAVPEPSTYGLVAAGVMGCLAWRRRTRAKRVLHLHS